jgi:RHS repeat-associated protein
MSYDDMDRCVESVAAYFDPATQAPVGDGQVVTRTGYSDCSQIVRSEDDNGHEARTYYDTANRVLRQEDHLTNSVTFVRDAAGNVVSTVTVERPSSGGPPRVFVGTNVYDRLNRLVLAADNAGNTNRYAYDSRNNRVLAVDGRGNVARLEFDGLSRVVKTTRFLTGDGTGAGAPAGTIVHASSWDDSGRLLAQTDGNGNTFAYAYDALGRVSTVTLPDGRTAANTYNAHGDLVTHTDPNGTAITHDYDANGRLARKTVAPGPGVSSATTFETFTYDGMGRVVRAEDNDSAVTRAFDSLSRVMRETINGRGVLSDRDGVGNLLRCEYPGGRTITNTYDALNRRSTVREGAATLASFDYAGPNRIGRVAYGNGTQLEYSYDAAPRVVRTLHVRDPGGARVTLDDRRYTWDPAFNKTSRSDELAGVTNRYSYDSVNRMVRSERTGSAAVDYALDAVGNRNSVSSGPDAGAYQLSAASPEPADRQVNQYTATPFDRRSYDGNGNLLTRNQGLPDQRAYAFDFKNQLVGFSDAASGAGASYAYDVFGRRIEKTVTGPTPSRTLYSYLDAHIVEEFDAATNSVATHVYGDVTDQRISYRRGGQDRHVHVDDLGSVTRITDASGNVVEQYEYGDYGAVTILDGAGLPRAQTAVGNAYGFTGREIDPETGFYYYRTRHLEPLSGRFIARDRIGAWGDAVNLGNAQAYAGNNPWSGTDPFGETFTEATGGFVMGGASLAADAWMAPGMLVASIPDMAVGTWNKVTHPVETIQGTWNGVSTFFTEVAAHPDGIGWGYLEGLGKRMFPGMLRKGRCWYYMSSYERGYAWGRQSAEIVTTATGGGGAIIGARRAAAWYAKDFKPYVRPGIWFRTDAGFQKKGMMTDKEYNMMRRRAKETGKPIIISGSFSETRVGFKRRMDPEAQPYLPAYRQGKPRSGLLDGKSRPDVDLAEISGLTPDEIAQIQKDMPYADVGVDYLKEKGYVSTKSFEEKGGALVFHPDGSVERVNAAWHRPHFESEGRAGLHREWWKNYDK